MTKPHEEEWELDADGDIRCLNKKGVRTSLVLVKAAGSNADRARLASKAPKMARVLLEIREALIDGTLDQSSAVDVCERVLRETGVLE